MMTLEELKTEADKFGYVLVEKSKLPEPLVTCLPCSCGKSKRIRKHVGNWHKLGKSDKYYAFYIFCEKCGKEGPHIWYDDYVDKLGCYTKTQRQMENISREAWNKMIREETNGEE